MDITDIIRLFVRNFFEILDDAMAGIIKTGLIFIIIIKTGLIFIIIVLGLMSFIGFAMAPNIIWEWINYGTTFERNGQYPIWVWSITVLWISLWATMTLSAVQTHYDIKQREEVEE